MWSYSGSGDAGVAHKLSFGCTAFGYFGCYLLGYFIFYLTVGCLLCLISIFALCDCPDCLLLVHFPQMSLLSLDPLLG